MCGIAGLIGLKYDMALLRKMQATIARRGPDEKGVFTTEGCALVHTRLSIVDPVGGKQPMGLQWGSEEYTLVYNGELYNTDELRAELEALGHTFRGHSDTEVILHGYAQWGEGLLHKCNGIFAFGVWEDRQKRLFLARDRMGVKPLFYMRHDEGFLFGSEIKAILAYPTVKAELDEEGVAQILMLGPGRAPGSGIFHGIQELEPGCCGCYEDGKWLWHRYWKLTDREHRDTFEQTVEKVRYLVEDAICRQMVSDVPIGTFLSGGLDSSLISAVVASKLREKGETLKTFSVDYENNERHFVPGKFQPNSDNSYIRIMQTYLESDHRWTVLTPEDLVGELEEATIARDLPGMADVDFSLSAFSKQIRKEVKMALSGECADEIFGGYPWYRDPEVRAVEGFPWAQNTKQRASCLQGWIAQRIDPTEFVRSHYQKTLDDSDILPGTSQQERRMKQMVNLNHRWFMQTLLDRKDRMSMNCGLEVRVPFCDYRIAEYLYSVPWEYKDYQGREKGLLRCAMEKWLPEEVLYRKKSPYPKTYDPRYLELVIQKLRHVLSKKDAPILQLVRKEALEDLLESEYAWPWYGQLMKLPQTIAYMLQINFWLEHYAIQIR